MNFIEIKDNKICFLGQNQDMKLYTKLIIQCFSKINYVIFLFFLGFLMIACADTSDDDSSSISSQCTDTANYTITFESTWSSSTHPTDFPSNPHFSGLIGATHNGNVSFWKEGEIASTGIENMAERGSKTELSNEISTAISETNADSILSGDGIDPSPGTVSLQFDISPDFSKVTLVSMVAPSPDWFVGISGVDLCENGEWLTTKSIDLFAYDAGTDSGTTYTSEDEDTTPQENITKLTTGIFYVDGTVPKLGTFTFIKN